MFISTVSITNAIEEDDTPLQYIDLTQAINLSLTKNLDYLIAEKNITVAKNDIKIANKLQNPSIGYKMNFGRSAVGNPNELGMSQLIEIGKRNSRKNVAKSELELTKENVAYLKFNLKLNVIDSYVALITSKYLYKTLSEHEKLLHQWYIDAEKDFKAKKISQLDFLQAEIALSQIIPEINTARVNIETSRFNFNKNINANEKILYDVQDSPLQKNSGLLNEVIPKPTEEIPSYEYILESAIQNRYDIRIAKQEVKIAQKNLVATTRKCIPDLEVAGGYVFQAGSMTDTGLFQKGAFIGMNIVNIPILYNYSPEIKNAKIKVDQAQMNYDSVVNKAHKDLISGYKRFITARTNLNYYDQKLRYKPDALLNISKQDYAKKKIDVTALIVMEQSCRDITMGYINAVSNYYDSWIDLLREVQDSDLIIGNDKL